MARVLILCPTFDHADTLFASIASVQGQTFADWEMAVICDGSPPRTDEVLAEIAAREPRIRIYRHPKAERFGEIYRDPVIRESSAEFVCHLSDDDIWLSDHLGQMMRLLEHADWANQAPMRLDEAGGIEWWPINHGTTAMHDSIRRRLPLSAGINYVAYRRAAYLRLAEGWTCAPWEAGTSDVYMWAKFFHDQDLKVASSAVTSALKFPSTAGNRGPWTPTRRLAEIAPWLARAATPGLGDALRRRASILTRMVMLFSLHGAAASLDGTFAQAGLQPASEAALPAPALDGAPMVLPLTEGQRGEARIAWRFTRAYVEGDATARAEIPKTFAEGHDRWIASARALGLIAGVNAGIDAMRDCIATYPNAQEPRAVAADLLRRAGRVDEAQLVLRGSALPHTSD